MWFFKDLNCGNVFLFSTEEDARKFEKDYGLKMYELNDDFPVRSEDYQLNRIEVTHDLKKALKKLFPEE